MTEGTGISPEFLELIQRAASETISIPLASRAIATKFRQRLHSARKHLMRAAGRPNATPTDKMLATLAEQIETSIVEAEGSAMLIVRPRDSQFRDALRAVGIGGQPQPIQGTVADTHAPAASPPADPLHAYLKGDKS